MYDPIADLRRVLAFHLTGTTDMPSHISPDWEKIMFLSGIVREYAVMGDYPLSEVLNIFRNHKVPGFDILLWIRSKEADGTWDVDEDEE